MFLFFSDRCFVRIAKGKMELEGWMKASIAHGTDITDKKAERKGFSKESSVE